METRSNHVLVGAVVLILLAIPGSQLLVYPILWLLMPEETPVTVLKTPNP